MDTPRVTLERAVVWLVIGSLGLLAAAYDGLGLYAAWARGGAIEVARAFSAVTLGWMCGWYFTLKFQPTHRLLLTNLMNLSGHLIAVLAAITGFALMGALELVGADPHQATVSSLAAVTFAPVAAWFATQLHDERSVHLLSGFGIGALSYIVLFGVPG